MPVSPGNGLNKAYPADIACEEVQSAASLRAGFRGLLAGKSEVVACCLNEETCSEDSSSEQCVPRVAVKPSDRKLPHLRRLKEIVTAFLKFLSKSVAMGFN